MQLLSLPFLLQNHAKLMASEKTQDKPTANMESYLNTPLTPTSIAVENTSTYSPVKIQNTGDGIRDNKLLYSTNPRVFKPGFVTMYLMSIISVTIVI